MQASDLDISPVGASTMSPAMERMQCYTRYLIRQVKGVLGNRVLEIGCGYGQVTHALASEERSVLATDIDQDFVARARQRFENCPNISVGWIDLNDEDSILAHRNYAADTIVCFNVLEHIRDDEAALRWLHDVVAKEAGLGLIVPAHQRLYGKMDKEAGHFRRYTRESLTEVLSKSGWTVRRSRYINLVGGLGWWYHNRVRANAGLTDPSVNAQMLFGDRWLPRIARFTDPIFSHIMGLSVMVSARA